MHKFLLSDTPVLSPSYHWQQPPRKARPNENEATLHATNLASSASDARRSVERHLEKQQASPRATATWSDWSGLDTRQQRVVRAAFALETRPVCVGRSMGKQGVEAEGLIRDRNAYALACFRARRSNIKQPMLENYASASFCSYVRPLPPLVSFLWLVTAHTPHVLIYSL
jgi:hypothetical protein